MSDLKLRLEGMLSFIDLNGPNGFDDSKVEELEKLVLECNRRHGKDSDFEILDSIYDTLYDMLKTVKPTSGVLSEIWEDSDEEINDYKQLLDEFPMYSIETAKSYDCKALSDFYSRMPEEPTGYFASFKINGHGIRVVYDRGDLVSATSRARGSNGRDLTRHMRVLLGKHNERLEEYGQVEFRGEIALAFRNLDKAREFNPSIKSAFSGVSSLIKPSATEEEIRLLDFLCYGMLMEGFQFSDREEEFAEIQRLGFDTPEYLLIDSATREELPDIIPSVISTFEEGYDEFGFFCDGVVFEVNDRDLFYSMPIEGNHRTSNIALKVGLWEQVQYCGYVQEIIWTKGKSKLSPVAIVADQPNMMIKSEDGKYLNWDDLGVLSAQGNKVRRVPLYEPKNILILDAYVGNPIWFRYGGEAGVVPCFSDGRLLKEDVCREILSGEFDFGTEPYNNDNFGPLIG